MPPPEYHFWVYIMASRSLQLYIGFTSQLRTRVAQHKELRAGTHTAQYNITRLVYFEHFQYVNNAIARENELKGWLRIKKLALIRSTNPTFIDLSEDWYKDITPSKNNFTSP
jgi:putative endonuclease